MTNEEQQIVTGVDGLPYLRSDVLRGESGWVPKRGVRERLLKAAAEQEDLPPSPPPSPPPVIDNEGFLNLDEELQAACRQEMIPMPAGWVSGRSIHFLLPIRSHPALKDIVADRDDCFQHLELGACLVLGAGMRFGPKPDDPQVFAYLPHLSDRHKIVDVVQTTRWLREAQIHREARADPGHALVKTKELEKRLTKLEREAGQ
jgi:hypothetical protein